MTHAWHDRILMVEKLSEQLHHLLQFKTDVLHKEGAHGHAQQLAHWGDNYHEGLRCGTLDVDAAATHGEAWLAGVNDRLMMESEELYRSEPMSDMDDDEHPEIEDFIESARWVIRAVSDDARVLTLQSIMPSQTREDDMTSTRVKDLMKKNPVIITPDMTLKEVAQEMERIGCGALPVGTTDKIEGIITDRDIVVRAVARGRDVTKERVRDYMTRDIFAVSEEENAQHAVGLMRENHVNRLVVHDEVGRPRGILTFGRMLRENGSVDEIASAIESTVGRHKVA